MIRSPKKSPKRTVSGEADTNFADINPLKVDPELQTLIKRLDGIQKYKKFQGWKDKFLSRLDSFLLETGMAPSEKASNDFDKTLNNFMSKHVTKLQGFIERGELGHGKKTVKASLALNEMCKNLESLRSDVETLIPRTNKEEKLKKFTKFHLGASLIRQGFHQYKAMKDIETGLEYFKRELKDVADKQQLDLFESYNKQVQRFCDVMADLGLYEVMMKCLQFAEEPEDESEDPEPINITIKSSDGKVIHLELEPCETIGSIKDAIAEAVELEPDDQVLILLKKTLSDDNATLESLGVQDGAVFTVEAKKISITVNTWEGKRIELMVDPKEYLRDLKKELESKTDIPSDNQCLTLYGKELDDDLKRLNELSIKPGSVLDLEPKTITIKVELPDGSVRDVDIKPNDTTDMIKKKIEDQTGFEAPRQMLTLNGEELPTGSDKTARKMGIRQRSPIKIQVLTVPVTVNTIDGKKIKINVDPYEPLSAIKKRLEDDTGLPAANQRIYLNGKELDDDNKPAKDYGIKAGTVLDMEPKTMKIIVEIPFELEISPSDTSDDIKKKIESLVKVKSSKQQVLKFGGKELAEGNTVKQMGLKAGSTVKVENA